MAGWNPDPAQASSDQVLIQRFFPWIGGAVLVGCAAFSYPGRDYVLIGLLLFLPLLDRGWRVPNLPRSRSHHVIWAGLLISGVALLVWRPAEVPFAFATLSWEGFFLLG